MGGTLCPSLFIRGKGIREGFECGPNCLFFRVEIFGEFVWSNLRFSAKWLLMRILEGILHIGVIASFSKSSREDEM